MWRIVKDKFGSSKSDEALRNYMLKFLKFDYRAICFDLDETLIDLDGKLYPKTVEVLKECRLMCDEKATTLTVHTDNPVKIPMYMLSRNTYVEEFCRKLKIDRYFDGFFYTYTIMPDTKVKCYLREQEDLLPSQRVAVDKTVLFDDHPDNILEWFEEGGMPMLVADGDIGGCFDLFCYIILRHNRTFLYKTK